MGDGQSAPTTLQRGDLIKKIIIYFSFAILVLFPNAAFSGQRGDELLRALTNPENMDSVKGAMKYMYAMGYISGILDTLSSFSVIAPKSQPPACLPKKGISNDQAIRIVVKYLENHPEDLHYSSRLCVLLALAKAFPCNEKRKNADKFLDQ